MRVAVLIALSLPSLTCATTLVALWTPDSIILGADSRVITDSGPLEACKIGHKDEVWVAASGLVTESRSGFQFGPMAQLALAHSGGLQQKMFRFAEVVHGPLTKALAVVRLEAPADYARIQTGRPVLQAIFATREAGKPVMATIAFVLGADGELQPRASLIDGADRRGPRIIYAGQQERIREYLRSHPDWLNGDRQALVRNLVQLEVDAGTPFVGGPVDVMQIDAGGPHWIQRKAACVRD
jgi:hypothetical protein